MTAPHAPDCDGDDAPWCSAACVERSSGEGDWLFRSGRAVYRCGTVLFGAVRGAVQALIDG